MADLYSLLTDVLNRCPNTLWAEMQRKIENKLENSSAIFIFGAGQNGKSISKKLMHAGYSVHGFIDETPNKQNQTIEGLPVYSLQTAGRIIKKNALVIVSIFNPNHSFLKSKARLEKFGWQVISLFDVGSFIKNDFLPFYFLNHPDYIKNAVNFFHEFFELLIDERSKRELISHLNFRMCHNFDDLLQPIGQNFSYLNGYLNKDVTFIDGGAFDGDTIRAFLNLVNNNYSHILAFEPDPENFLKLDLFCKSLPFSFNSKISIMNAGVWSKSGVLGFSATATAGSHFSPDALNKCKVIALDEYHEFNTSLLIKLDVEGAEHDALYGAQRILQDGRAILILAIYHKPDDLVTLPKLILKFNSNYRFALRSHGYDGGDLMLYAIPKNFIH